MANVMQVIPVTNDERQQEQGSRVKQSRETCNSERSLDHFLKGIYSKRKELASLRLHVKSQKWKLSNL